MQGHVENNIWSYITVLLKNMELDELLLKQEISQITVEHDNTLNSLLRHRFHVSKEKASSHSNKDESSFEDGGLENFFSKYEVVVMSGRKQRSLANDDTPAIYMEQQQNTRTCQNMNGVLGNY